VAIDDLDTLTAQARIMFIQRPMDIAIGPGRAVIGGALGGVTGAQIFISGGLILILLLSRLVLFQLLVILFFLLLILLLLLVGGGRALRRLRFDGGVGARNLIVQLLRLGVFFRRRMGGGHAIGIDTFTVRSGHRIVGGIGRKGKKRAQHKGAGCPFATGTHAKAPPKVLFSNDDGAREVPKYAGFIAVPEVPSAGGRNVV